MPIFNAGAFLEPAIASVLAQTTHLPWELLLIDDGSTDLSLQCARRFEERHPARVRVLRHPSGANRGTSASRNLGMRCARGATLAFLDADDIWLPHMLELQSRLLARHPEAMMAYANAERTWEMSLPCSPRTGPQGYNTLPPVLPPGATSGLPARNNRASLGAQR